MSGEEENRGGDRHLTASKTSLNSLDQTPEVRNCCDCKKTFKSCSCKSCAKCGALFQKYWGTPVVKGRSHCRICCAAVCITCHVIVYDTFKICTRCHIKQKEDELSTQMALSAISNAKSCSELGIENLSLAATKVSSQEKKNEILCSASKKGDHHVVSTILTAGADVHYKDNEGNTALYYASRGAHLPCMALLLEKSADCTVANKYGWTPLHALATHGKGENMVECADLLIQMGADVFATTENNETAGDLAEQNGQQNVLIDILRAAEVEEAVRCLYNRMSNSEISRDGEIKKYLKTILQVVTNLQCQKLAEYPFCMAEESNARTTDFKKTMSLNRVFSRPKSSNQVCQFCGHPAGSRTQLCQADVEPVLRTDLKEPDAPQIKRIFHGGEKIKEQLAKCVEEKEELEQRCKRLMNSISAAAGAAEQQELEVSRLKRELDGCREERDLAIQRCEATCTNKLTKIRQEADFSVHKAQERVAEVEKEITDLVHLHSTYKLSWIPDKIVFRCMNSKCRTPFGQTKRRHHCRCCGRVFCSSCTSNLSPLHALGYSDPVRLCTQCFALLDETFEMVDFPEVN